VRASIFDAGRAAYLARLTLSRGRDDDDDFRYGRRKKKGFLGELFDFD
jgi:hypothetical protein